MTQSDDMKALKRFTWAIPKNRYGINNLYTQVGVIYEKMRIIPADDGIHIIGEIDHIENMSGVVDENLDAEIDDGSDFLSNRINQNNREKSNRLSGIDFE
jgi:hypothetical protein